MVTEYGLPLPLRCHVSPVNDSRCFAPTAAAHSSSLFLSYPPLLLLERVQKRATKILSQHRHLSYTDRLKVYKLPTLHYRQIRGDMIELYKIITGKYERVVAPRLERDDISVTRGNELRLKKLGRIYFRGPHWNNSVMHFNGDL